MNKRRRYKAKARRRLMVYERWRRMMERRGFQLIDANILHETISVFRRAQKEVARGSSSIVVR